MPLSDNFNLNIINFKNISRPPGDNQSFRGFVAPPKMGVGLQGKDLELERPVEIAEIRPLKLEREREVFVVLVPVGQGRAVGENPGNNKGKVSNALITKIQVECSGF